ncbi:MAG: hypothetical protein ABL309_13775 [Phycisphaerales bacterium]
MPIDRNLENRKPWTWAAFAVNVFVCIAVYAVSPEHAPKNMAIATVLVFCIPLFIISVVFPKGVNIKPEPGDVGYEEWLAEKNDAE